MTKKLTKSLRELNRQKSDKLNLISGVLGITINGNNTVEVPNRDGYVFVRLRGNTSELIQAYNGAVSPIFGLPILVTYENNRYAIYGRDTEKYGNWGESAYLPKHGEQHSFAPELGLGGDVAWIYSRQFVPLLFMPSGSAGAGNLIVNSHIYLDPIDTQWKFIGDEGTPNLLGAKPTGSSARIMLGCWDITSQDPVFITGSFFPNTITGTAAIVPYIPTISSNRLIPSVAVRLVSGTSEIGWENIYDVRQFAVSVTPPFMGGIMIQDEGSNVGTGAILNFVGENISATVTGDTARIYVTGTAMNFQDEGAPLGTARTINVVGVNADVSISGSVARIFVTGSVGAGGGGSGSLIFWDEGINKGSATILNVVGEPATLSISGTVAQLLVVINTGTIKAYADTQYLRLDATNDPVRGNLYITGSVDLEGNLSAVTQSGGHYFESPSQFHFQDGGIFSNTNQQPIGLDQEVQDGAINYPVAYLSRYTTNNDDAPTFNEPAILVETYPASGSVVGGLLKYDLNGNIRTHINPSESGTGTATLLGTDNQLSHHGKLIMLENAGTPKFWVNASGTAFERNTPLAKTSGVFATFTTVDGKTVTVRDGIIVSVV